MIKLSYLCISVIFFLCSDAVLTNDASPGDICGHCLYGQDYCQASGQCLYGCVHGWMGENCDQPCSISRCLECDLNATGGEICRRCSSGFYGPQCVQPCNKQCFYIGDSLDVCNRQGHCLFGCEQGWQGDFCDKRVCPFSNCQICSHTITQVNYCKSCVTGHFWSWNIMACILCSRTCFGGVEACDTENGNCLNGCQQGYFGSHCNYHCQLKDCLNCSMMSSGQGTQKCAVCKPGYYPEETDKHCVPCGQHCIGGCNSTTGHCSQCEDHWFSDRCDQFCDVSNCHQCGLQNGVKICKVCNDGFFSSRNHNFQCKACPEFCLGGPTACNKTTGTCINGCQPGRYGEICQYQCSQHCVDTCDTQDGTCSCQEGWFGDICNRDCPVNCASCHNYTGNICSSCRAGFHGPQCQYNCSKNCLRNAHTSYLYCHQDTGSCSDGCINGFYGDLCNKACSETCADRVCRRDTGQCSYGCSHYHYGNNCDQRCSQNCKDFYTGNQRSCDMTSGSCIHGCKENRFHGDFCNLTCNYRCKDQSCDQKTGLCTSGCMIGYYGINCDRICNENCADGSCEMETGVCNAGCRRGYYGSLCNLKCHVNCIGGQCQQQGGACIYDCEDGLYGPMCNLNCKENCLNNVCQRDTGMCSSGCLSGKRGDFCEEDCSLGYYGKNCDHICGRCKNNIPCSIIDGSCQAGCEEGFQGDMCNMQVTSHAADNHLEVAIPAGSTVGALVVSSLIVVVVVFFCHRNRRMMKQKSPEPSVLYTSAGTSGSGSVSMTVPTVHESPRRTLVRLDAPTIERDNSDVSVHEVFSPLMRDRGNSSVLKLGSVQYETSFYVVYSGRVCLNGDFTAACVKVVHFDDVEQAEKTNRLKKESEILNICGSHQNLVNLLSVQQDPEMFCLCLENYTKRSSLQSYLLRVVEKQEADEAANLHQQIQFVIDVSYGVAHLHSKRIIHRHLMASSVYLTDNLVPKIGDFDWSEKLTETYTNTIRFPNLDTLPEDNQKWQAPESLSHHVFSTETDVWSLGVLIWQIFTSGDMPYKDLDSRIFKNASMYVSLLPKPVTASFTMYRVMKKCWRYAPEDRLTAEQVSKQFIQIQTRLGEEQQIMAVTV